MSACRKPDNPFPNMYIAEDGMDSWVGCGRERPGFQPAAPAPPRLSLPPTPRRALWKISGADLEPISAGEECDPLRIIR